jgi:TolB-like protein
MDPRSGELRGEGRVVTLQDQPLRLLTVLLERAGELVTRDELRQRLWAADTYVDFEHGLNAAVKRLRDALGDSAESPRYIETVPKRGYRLVAVLPERRPPRARRSAAVALLGCVVTASVAAGSYLLTRDRSASASPPRSIAVLPLKNLTGDSAQEYLAQGMTDALNTTLSQIGTLKVVSSTSTGGYRDRSLATTRIARELGVEALVEGALHRSGDRVRVSVALIDARSDRRVWAASYDRHLRDVLSLYTEIARAITSELSTALTPHDRARLTAARAVAPEAYEHYLRATHLTNRWTRGGCLEAEPHLLKAIELDPQFAPSQALLAWCYVFPARTGRPLATLMPRGRALAARALQLDDESAAAHIAQAYVQWRFDFDWRRAEEHFRRALVLDPNSADAHLMYGEFLYMSGRGDEGIPLVERSLRLDPFASDRNVAYGFALKSVRRYDEAVAQYRATLELEPAHHMARYLLAETEMHAGRYDNAVREYLDWVEKVFLDARGREMRAELRAAYERAGWPGFARRELQLAQECQRAKGWGSFDAMWSCSSFHLARRHGRLGDDRAALSALAQALAEGHHLLPTIGVDPAFDALREDPAFVEIARAVGLPASATTARR